jgi:hypothetical protein
VVVEGEGMSVRCRVGGFGGGSRSDKDGLRGSERCWRRLIEL